MSERRSILRYLAAAGVVVVLLVVISVCQTNMNRLIDQHKLTDTDPVENAPPIVAFTTVALGSFRGLLADILWLRTTTLQDQGKYYEMVQLASWITKLQPRFTGATAYLAWNMAYNISVTCSSFEDRWRWVQRGIELIRDEALVYNPGDPILYKELGWIYQHKIGNILDDANLYYKRELALAMTKAFGGAEPNWRKLASAARNETELSELLGPASQWREKLAKAGFDSLSKLRARFREDGGLPDKLKELLTPGESDALDGYLRRQWLVDVYKLDPTVVIDINQKYGKLDWRLPESYAVYWATQGIRHAPDGKNIDCKRMITQSLKDAFMGGRLLMVGDEGFLTVPNLNVVDAVARTYEEAYEQHKSKSFRSALNNFLKDAVVTLFNYGQYTKAEEYLKRLRKAEPYRKDYKVNLDRFVMKEWVEDVRDATLKQVMDVIGGLVYQWCYFLAYGDSDAADARERLARFVYDYYTRENEGVQERLKLPAFDNIKKNVVKGCLRGFPPALRDNLQAAVGPVGGDEK